MTEEFTEPSKIEEPEKEPREKGENIDAKDLLSELEKLGITSPEKLHGVVTASQQAGRNAQLLGASRREAEMLQQQMAELQRQIASQRNTQASENYYSDDQDLKSVVKAAFAEMYDEKVGKPQKEVQRQYLKQLEEIKNIKSDKRFAMVADRWDTHMSSPEVQIRLQMGETTPLNEYNNLVLDTMQNLLFKTKSTVEQLYNKGAKVATSDAPHMESAETQTVLKPGIDEEIDEKVKKITKPKNRKGTDDEIHDLMMTFIPKDDPIWQKNK